MHCRAFWRGLLAKAALLPPPPPSLGFRIPAEVSAALFRRTTGQRPARRYGGRHAGWAGHGSAAPPGRGRVSALILSWISI